MKHAVAQVVVIVYWVWESGAVSRRQTEASALAGPGQESTGPMSPHVFGFVLIFFAPLVHAWLSVGERAFAHYAVGMTWSCLCRVPLHSRLLQHCWHQYGIMFPMWLMQFEMHLAPWWAGIATAMT